MREKKGNSFTQLKRQQIVGGEKKEGCISCKGKICLPTGGEGGLEKKNTSKTRKGGKEKL